MPSVQLAWYTVVYRLYLWFFAESLRPLAATPVILLAVPLFIFSFFHFVFHCFLTNVLQGCCEVFLSLSNPLLPLVLNDLIGLNSIFQFQHQGAYCTVLTGACAVLISGCSDGHRVASWPYKGTKCFYFRLMKAFFYTFILILSLSCWSENFMHFLCILRYAKLEFFVFGPVFFIRKQTNHWKSTSVDWRK